MRSRWMLGCLLFLAVTPGARALGPEVANPFDEPPCYCTFGQLEYLYWWMKSAPMPNLLNVGTTAANSSLAYGGPQQFDGTSGGRFRVGAWFDDMGTFGAEAGAFLMETRTSLDGGNFAGSTAGGSDIFLLFNPSAAGPTTQQFSNLKQGFAASNQLNLWGGNADFVITPVRYLPVEVNLLAGFQYLDLAEVYQLNVFSANSGFLDRFATSNHFFGGEVGGRVTFRNSIMFMELMGKVGLGSNRQVLQISGSGAAGGGGLYAQPSNIGEYAQNEFTAIPQARIRVGLDVSSSLKFWLGYDYIYINSVLRPGNTIDTVFNTTPLGANTTRPMVLLNASDFYAHGISFGGELRF